MSSDVSSTHSAHYIQCTLQLHHPVHTTSSAPLDHQKGKPVYYWPTSRVSCLADADKMFEEMVWCGYLPAPVAEIDQKMKQDGTG